MFGLQSTITTVLRHATTTRAAGSEFEADGTYVAHDNATTWKDELGPLVGQKLENPSAHIEINLAEGALGFETGCTLSDYVVMSPQINHDWKSGTSVDVHLHWVQASSSTPNWLIQYRWQSNGQAKTTSWTNLPWNHNVFTYVSGSLNQITAFGEVAPPANYAISDILQIRLLRDVGDSSGLFSGADPVNATVYAVSLDFHKECDTLGSRTEFTK